VTVREYLPSTVVDSSERPPLLNYLAYEDWVGTSADGRGLTFGACMRLMHISICCTVHHATAALQIQELCTGTVVRVRRASTTTWGYCA